MGPPAGQAKTLLTRWARKPNASVALSLRQFYSRNARRLPLRARAELCLALGEAAKLEGRVDQAKWLYASAVGAVNAQSDERLYASAVLRSLLNASRLGEVALLQRVAALMEKTPPEQQTPRLAFLRALPRGPDALLPEGYDPAPRR